MVGRAPAQTGALSVLCSHGNSSSSLVTHGRVLAMAIALPPASCTCDTNAGTRCLDAMPCLLVPFHADPGAPCSCVSRWVCGVSQPVHGELLPCTRVPFYSKRGKPELLVYKHPANVRPPVCILPCRGMACRRSMLGLHLRPWSGVWHAPTRQRQVCAHWYQAAGVHTMPLPSHSTDSMRYVRMCVQPCPVACVRLVWLVLPLGVGLCALPSEHAALAGE